MSKQILEQLIRVSLQTLQQQAVLPQELPAIQLESTKDQQHGDFASNIAMMLAKLAHAKPRDLAEKIVQALPSSPHVQRVEIAGPGFINFFLAHQALHSVIPAILTAGEKYGHTQHGQGKRVLVEFVSTNPTGPLHVGHGRHAAYGTVVCDLLETIGYDVHREYYVNDAGRQMDILAVSVWLRYLELCGEIFSFPANGYRGDYIVDIARTLHRDVHENFLHAAKSIFENLPLDESEGGDKEIYIDAVITRAKEKLGEASYQILFDLALTEILRDIREDLSEFGVAFQKWFSEREFTKTDAVNKNIDALTSANLTYEKEGALWFKATAFGDDNDRVLRRSNGQRTYFANDFAYHVNKFERGFDSAIDIFGSDHHGYIPRMKAALQARGIPDSKLIYLLVQFVTLYRAGQQAQMSTRSGSFVPLRELRAEVGNDAARFFYVMRKREQHVDFDLDLAKSQSNENPVYYIQYAHARICSVFRQLEEKGLAFEAVMTETDLTHLSESHELQLSRTLARYQDVILSAATQYEPHLLTNYLRDVANDFHAYYNSHPFLVAESALRNARLTLILATRQILANGLKLVGVSAPESM